MGNNVEVSNMLRVGTVLRGVYRIDGYLSSGGFGNTYVATNIEFDERYAVKEFFMSGVSQRDANNTTVSVSNTQNRDAFASQLEKFKKEARRLRKLHSPHIVRVYDLFEENGTAYYVMDYIEGENLSDYLRRTGKPMPEAEVMRILPQILDALNTAHSAGIWHLDLKPANIMLDKQGNVRLIDFGASKQRSSKGGATTSTAVSYTNGYAPREQMEQNLDKFGPWTDFYALGATLYTLLTSKKPPLPSDIDDDESRDKHVALPMTPPISRETRDLVLWMMNTNRKLRPQSVAEIRARMGGAVEEDDTIVVKKPEPKPEPPVPEPDEPVGNPRKERNYILIAVLVVVGIVVGAAVMWKVGLGGNSSRPATEIDSVAAAVDSGVPSGATHVAQVSCNVAQGECTYTGYVDEQGVPNGEGEAWFNDGRYYKGIFVNGKMVDTSGDAEFVFANGDTFQGEFVDDHFSRGRYSIKADGSYFEGTFDANGQPSQGSWYDKQGNIIPEN